MSDATPPVSERRRFDVLPELGQGFDNLRSHKLRSVLTMLGMIFGVGAVIAMISIGAGAQQKMIAFIEQLGVRNVIVEARESTDGQTLQRVRKLSVGLSFNDYREAYGLSRLASFDDLTSDAEVRERLEALYGDIEKLEWYVGIFAEDYPDYMMMGELMTFMVANDAFTQALTNPLLARNVFTEATFTKTGMKILKDTGSLQQIATRNAAKPDDVHVSFGYGGAAA